MATFRKLPSGMWQARIARNGMRKSSRFETKRKAWDWAARQGCLALSTDPPHGRLTLTDACGRSAREESPKRRGARWKVIRLAKISTDKMIGKRLA